MTLATTRTSTLAQTKVTGPKNGPNGPKPAPNIQTTFLPVGMLTAAICRLVPKQDVQSEDAVFEANTLSTAESITCQSHPSSWFQTCSNAVNWKAGWPGRCSSVYKSPCMCSTAFHFVGI